MTPGLSGHFPIFGLVFLLNSLLEIARQRSSEKIAILTPKRRSHLRILIYRTWSIVYIIYGQWILADSSHHPESRLVLFPSTWTCPPSQYLSTPNCKNHQDLCSQFINMVKKLEMKWKNDKNYVYCNASRSCIVKMIEFMFFPIRQYMLTNPTKFGRYCINLCWNLKGAFNNTV